MAVSHLGRSDDWGRKELAGWHEHNEMNGVCTLYHGKEHFTMFRHQRCATRMVEGLDMLLLTESTPKQDHPAPAQCLHTYFTARCIRCEGLDLVSLAGNDIKPLLKRPRSLHRDQFCGSPGLSQLLLHLVRRKLHQIVLAPSGRRLFGKHL